ncbi:MAG: NAD(P) transhydrogenase subunit alpha [Terrimicrobiaceae bacterium]
MDLLFCPRQTKAGETRVALTPESAQKFREAGFSCVLQTGAGLPSGFADEDYRKAGCEVVEDRSRALASAKLIVGVHPLDEEDYSSLQPGTFMVGFLDPYRNPEKVIGLGRTGATTASLELLPRTTFAQKMDALSSQASLAGYAAVLLAAMRLDKVLPMMMTPAGTLQPCRFLIVGVGVAGLQAIATAKRLGARVTAFDTRPTVEEQVKSLGARFLKIDIGETGQTEQGYAKELTPEQKERQQIGMTKACTESDAIITTAQVFGRPAPKILTAQMLAGMRPGSVVIDMAVSTGGNVEGSEADEEVVQNGVRLIGASNLPTTLPQHASQALANNIFNYVSHVWKPGTGLDLENPDGIAKATVVTAGCQVVHDHVAETYKQRFSKPV